VSTDVALVDDWAEDPIEMWASRINAAWHKYVESIIETGKLLIEAKNALAHGQWGTMVSEKLHFNVQKVERLMAIARHPILSNPSHVTHLPPNYSTLSALTRLQHDFLQAQLDAGKINEDTERKTVESWSKIGGKNKPSKSDSRANDLRRQNRELNKVVSAQDDEVSDLKKEIVLITPEVTRLQQEVDHLKNENERLTKIVELYQNSMEAPLERCSGLPRDVQKRKGSVLGGNHVHEKQTQKRATNRRARNSEGKEEATKPRSTAPLRRKKEGRQSI
jgi:Protein of unknown function (DUF3102)